MISQIGKQKRLESIIGAQRRAFIVPVDDLLICGSDFQLTDYKEKIAWLGTSPINAILGFPGVFSQFYAELRNKPWIVNLTTSTYRKDHTDKRLAISLENAVAKGADAVAVHLNVTSPTEGTQIRTLATVSEQCDRLGIPLMAIAYARGVNSNGTDNNYLELKEHDIATYTNLVSHACRVAVELGADIIKTNFTGTVDSFAQVVYNAGEIPVVIAGGIQVDEEVALNNVKSAMEAGASGICFGRNFFYRENIPAFARKVNDIINAF